MTVTLEKHLVDFGLVSIDTEEFDTFDMAYKAIIDWSMVYPTNNRDHAFIINDDGEVIWEV